MTRLGPVVTACTLLSLACSASDENGQPPAHVDAPVTGGSPSTGGLLGTGGAPVSAGAPGSGGQTPAPPARTRCAAPAGLGAPPGTIDEVVTWLNALPKPTSVACFLESLPRPLAIVATNSQFSAQPALSAASPRVFLELGRLWVSAVIDGESSYLLEFGYRPPDSDLASIKGELALPLSESVSSNAPYERVRYASGTMCGFCHRAEQPVASVSPDVFVSDAIRPRPETYVSVAALQLEHARCDWSVNAHRCEMLSALFDGGPVSETAFPDTMATFF
jgi:hypothetical protein